MIPKNYWNEDGNRHISRIATKPVPGSPPVGCGNPEKGLLFRLKQTTMILASGTPKPQEVNS